MRKEAPKMLESRKITAGNSGVCAMRPVKARLPFDSQHTAKPTKITTINHQSVNALPNLDSEMKVQEHVFICCSHYHICRNMGPNTKMHGKRANACLVTSICEIGRP